MKLNGILCQLGGMIELHLPLKSLSLGQPVNLNIFKRHSISLLLSKIGLPVTNSPKRHPTAQISVF
jgi:hypothetical protein